MKYRNFEDLPVWNAASEFALAIFEFTSKADFRGVGDLKNQIRHSSNYTDSMQGYLHAESSGTGEENVYILSFRV